MNATICHSSRRAVEQRSHRFEVRCRSSSSPGFTLVDALVALLVLTMGFIGIASLYAERIRPGSGGPLHATAVELAQTIAAAIRANRDPGAIYENAMGVVCKPAGLAKKPEARAANEVACWQDDVEKALPNGSGFISLDTTVVPSAYTVTVSWSEPGARTASYVERVETTAAAPPRVARAAD
jgi:type IV pilus assembly protein PilV